MILFNVITNEPGEYWVAAPTLHDAAKLVYDHLKCGRIISARESTAGGAVFLRGLEK